MAEELGEGLQNLLQQCKSAPDLKKLPGWWNGRRKGLKTLGLNKSCGFESRSRYINAMKNKALESFLRDLDTQQSHAYSQIALFNKVETDTWTKGQRQWFVKVFYHTRGHFDRLLWTRLVSAETQEEKEEILTYMAEEAGLEDGKNWPSHEKLFEQFANSLGIELTPEVTEKEGYLPFIHDFNFNLISYFKAASRDMQEVLFMAYERLDNLDYESMYKVAKNLGVSGAGLTFFEVHKNSKHFIKTSENIEKLWDKDSDQLKKSFEMIYDNQLAMWKNLSDTVFNYKKYEN